MMEKSFLNRPLCLLCLAAAQEITHTVHSLSRSHVYFEPGLNLKKRFLTANLTDHKQLIHQKSSLNSEV